MVGATRLEPAAPALAYKIVACSASAVSPAFNISLEISDSLSPLLSRKDPLVLTQKGPLQDREFEQDSELQRCGFLLATWSGEFREPEEVNLEGHARKGH
jgi:hypothetical protein